MSDLPLDRRSLLALGAAVAAAPPMAQAAERPAPIPLWPGRPPGYPATPPRHELVDHGGGARPNRSESGVLDPHIAPVRPSRANGAALLIIPGGSYLGEWFDKEGFDVAERFAEAGITGFVLRYRLPAEGWAEGSEVPIRDAQRAMRLIRHHARDFDVDPARVGVMGFSAGGHLAASLSTRPEAAYAPSDAADAGPVRPDLSAPIYPVIDVAGPYAHAGSAKALMGTNPSAAAVARYTPTNHVDGRTPPTFLAHAADDGTVPVENTLSYLAALRANHVPAEAHIFEEGGHGFAIRDAVGRPCAAWPELFLAFAGRHGFLGKA